MQTYIQLVAQDLIHRFGKDMTKVAIVFPNKRASLFLNQALVKEAERLRREKNSCCSENNGIGGGKGEAGDTVMWSPTYITISELFRYHSSLHVADQILLICRLYDVFQRVTQYSKETLDQFYNWGALLLADFDDIDKNMADASKVFQLITDLHEMDNIDYLDDEQKETLKSFFKTFSDNSPSVMREKFYRLWQKLFEIYTTFRNELRADGIAYEGMMYREVAEQEDMDFPFDTYCFIGFNMLQTVERKIFMRLKNMPPRQKGGGPRALFYWDYDTYYVGKKGHEAGHFISEYLSLFPDALDGREKENLIASKKGTSITYLSATTENLQARYVHDWLLENDRWKAGARTAIVMADERLLMTIIRSLPEEVEKVNITTGFPLSQATIYALLQHLMDMQIQGRIPGTGKYLQRYVIRVLSHPYSSIISEKSQELLREITEKKVFYPGMTALCRDEGLNLLFGDLDSVEYHNRRDVTVNIKLTLWMQQLIQRIARSETLLSALDRESLFRTHQVLQRLLTLCAEDVLNVDITTFRRLIRQVIATTTVPYHGEPIEGIQIMGVLETRCLDFDHLLILSCNEGNMPKGINDSSFIPHNVRKAYGLTTVENKVGIYSYYFHRLLQRSKDVTLTYNSSTEGLNSGEMSRFMLQLMAESGVSVLQCHLRTQQTTEIHHAEGIQKQGKVEELLKKKLDTQKAFSPTELATYLRCQKLYFYLYVAGLKIEEESNPEEIDGIAFGLVFHAAAEMLYSRITDSDGVLHAEAIDNVLKKNATLVERCVDEAFRKEVFNIRDTEETYKPQYTGLQLINRRVIISLLGDLLRYDRKNAPITILGMEEGARVYDNLEVCIKGVNYNLRLGGIIDRLDMIHNDKGGMTIRVIDYKTGRGDIMKMASLSDVFSHDKVEKHSNYFLQAMLYSIIVRNSQKYNSPGHSVMPAVLYVQNLRRSDYSPYLQIDKKEISDVGTYEDEYLWNMRILIEEIFNTDIPFVPNGTATDCKRCRFRNLCGM